MAARPAPATVAPPIAIAAAAATRRRGEGRRASSLTASAAKYDRPAMSGPESSPRPGPAADAGRIGWLSELQALDVAVYTAIAAVPTPTLDRAATALSRAADGSKLWIGVAGLLAATGARGRRSAIDGLASIALTSAVVNLTLKPLRRRRRPDRVLHRVPLARQVNMPHTTSFPSGHAASAFAFASGVSHALPAAGVPLQAAAALVAYSRVHTGVHYPIDVIAGALIGTALAPLTTAALDRRRSR